MKLPRAPRPPWKSHRLLGLLSLCLPLALTGPRGAWAKPLPRSAASPTAPSPAPAIRGPKPFIMIPPKGMTVVKRPARVACALETDHFESPGWFQIVFPLLAAPGAAPFVTVVSGAVRVLVPAGPPKAPYVVEAESAGLFLRGYLGPHPKPERGAGEGALIVHPAKNQAVGGFYWPHKNALLRLTRHPRHGFAVSPVDPLPRELEPRPGALPARVPCDSLSLDPAKHDLALPLPAGKPRKIGLAGGAMLPLLDRPQGKVVATIHPRKGDIVDVNVYPPDRGHVLLSWDIGNATVLGYVQQRRLAAAERPPRGWGKGTRPDRLGYLFGTRLGRRSPDPRLICDDDVLLVVNVPPPAGVRRPPNLVVVGGFRAKTSIRIDGGDSNYTWLYEHALPHSVNPHPSNPMFVPNFMLGGCTRR